MMKTETPTRSALKAPFPWFGGKSRCAEQVWSRFGDVPNYVEPFAGSLAVLLKRPHDARCETVNDLDCYLANFWRAVSADPEQVAHFANWPVNEADLHARHLWLVKQDQWRERMKTQPDYFEAKVAGWWVWGISQWIGSGWCARPDWKGRTLPGRSNRGVHSGEMQTARVAGKNVWRKRPSLYRSNRGVQAKQVLLKTERRRPHVGSGGNGVLRNEIQTERRLPNIATNGTGGRGVLRAEFQSKLPQLSGDGSGSGRGVLSQGIGENLLDYMLALQDRLRRVRVCCGDWKRILGPSPTTCIGLTGVFLDPPYSAEAGRDAVYNSDDFSVAHEVREWALAHGDDPKMRIALCGYEGEHAMPAHWECVPWKANGGYGNTATGRGRVNAGRERIWFSPACLKPDRDLELFK